MWAFLSSGIIDPILVIFENRIPVNPALGGVRSHANYSVAYEETLSNRVSDFRDFVCSLFPKALFFVGCFFTIMEAEGEGRDLSFRKKHIFVGSALRFSNSSINHHGQQVNHRYSL